MIKSQIQLIKKLSLKKYRESEQKFIVEGKRLVEEGLKSNFKCLKLIATNEFIQKEAGYSDFLKRQSLQTNIISSRDFSKISTTKNPQGIFAVFEIPKKVNKILNDKVIICLENISDPGNLGTILRSCDWFGIKSVLVNKDCAELYNPKVLRASMGAIFNLDIFEIMDLVKEFKELKKQSYKIYFADMNGIDYREINNKGKKIITFCNEAFGPSNDLKEVSDYSITIPKKGNIDSLNVAAAAAVILSVID